MEQNHPPLAPGSAVADSPANPLTAFQAAATVMAQFPPTELQRMRLDGWTPRKQRGFCEALADSGIVRQAAEAVGMTRESAYKLRRKAEGKGFSLAWDAALVLAKPRLMELAVERAIDGNREILIKDGEVVGERKKQDVRHLLATLSRLEAMQRNDSTAQAIAREFDAFLDCVEADAAQPEGRITAFVGAREPDGFFARQDHMKAVDSIRRNGEFAAQLSSRSPIDDYTQDDLDCWDDIIKWEEEDRAAGRFPAPLELPKDGPDNAQTV